MWGASVAPDLVCSFKVVRCAVSHTSAVPIIPPKNSPPPRNLAPLLHALSPAFILSHALAGGLVLVTKMVVLCVVPTSAERCLPFSLIFLGGLDAFLDGAWGLATVVTGRSVALRFRRQGGYEESEGEEKATDGHGLVGAEIQSKVTTRNANQISRSFMIIARQREDLEASWSCREKSRAPRLNRVWE